MTRLLVLALAALITLPAPPAAAQTPGNVRVTVELRQTSASSRDAAGAGGRVVITERGGVRTRVRGGAESTEVRSRGTSGMFTLVQDGGEATLVVATQVPYPELSFYRDYATGHRHIASGVVFRDVGTSLRVRAHVLPDRRIRVRLTPSISWFSADGAGTIEFVEAATEVVVPNGQPVLLAGSTSDTHTVTRRMLGLDQQRASGETSVVLTATAQP